MRFNVAQLVADLGGAANAAKVVGTSRTAPYRWMKQGMVSTRVLASVKQQMPWLSIDRYFEDEHDKQSDAGSGA